LKKGLQNRAARRYIVVIIPDPPKKGYLISTYQRWSLIQDILGCPGGSAGKRLGSVGNNPNISQLQVGEKTHLLTSWDLQVHFFWQLHPFT